jgi:hypothetical protein
VVIRYGVVLVVGVVVVLTLVTLLLLALLAALLAHMRLVAEVVLVLEQSVDLEITVPLLFVDLVAVAVAVLAVALLSSVGPAVVPVEEAEVVAVVSRVPLVELAVQVKYGSLVGRIGHARCAFIYINNHEN